MESMSSLIGIAIAAIVFLQFAAWTGFAFRRLQFDRRQFDFNQKLLRRKLDLAFDSKPTGGELGWHGFRAFSVQRIQPEAEDCVSIDLVPEDGRQLPFFLPGQHIAIRLAIPGQSQATVRCYSLSDAPHPSSFRITVRAIQNGRSGSESSAGLASHFLNHRVKIGERIDSKAPSGSFHLDLNDRRPTVFLAGGIGITPIMSMLSTLAEHRIPREVLLVYGVRNSRHHTFRKQLSQIANGNSQLNIVTFYSGPLPDDRLGVDYQVEGHVSIKTIRRLVPSNQIPFYVCGPAPFMHSLITDLREWGVAQSNLHYEAFGPASIQSGGVRAGTPSIPAGSRAVHVQFNKSSKSVCWPSGGQTLLELADGAGVPIPSGCRAGNCGTCQTRLISGQTAYADGVVPTECDPGSVLTCIARPIGDVVLDA